MNVRIEPAQLSGTVRVPASKSIIQRAVLCAAFASGTSVIENYSVSGDVSAAVSCARTFGAAAEENRGSLRITGMNPAGVRSGKKVFSCGESATAFRLSVPAAVCMFGECEFRLGESLYSRPDGAYLQLFGGQGIEYIRDAESRSLTTKGRLRGGRLTVDGSVSSQFISGMLLALPFCKPDTVLTVCSFTQSLGYAEMTAKIMKAAGITVTAGDRGYKAEQREYRPFGICAEPDMSHAALWQAAELSGNSISVADISGDSIQPDKVFFTDFLPELKKSGTVRIDVSQNPDLAPAIAAAACFRDGETVMENCARLKYKESNRISSICGTLNAFGVETFCSGDEITVCGKGKVRGADADCGNDHRIAMMAAVIAAGADSGSVLRNAECVNKSYPGFFRDYNSIGGKAYEL